MRADQPKAENQEINIVFMPKIDEAQKKLNDLLEGNDDGREEDVFLNNEPQAGDGFAVPRELNDRLVTKDELTPIPNEPSKAVREEEETRPLYERWNDNFFNNSKKEDDLQETALPATDSVGPKVDVQEEKEGVDEIKAAADRAKEFIKNNLNLINRQEELNEKIKAMERERKEDQIKMKAMNLGLGYINLKGLPIVAEALKVVDEGTAKQHNMVCFLYKKGEEIRLATTGMDNNEQGLVERIKQDYPGLRVVVFLTSEDSVEAALKLYSALPRRVERIDDIKVLEKEIETFRLEIHDIFGIQEKINQASTTEILSIIIMAAARVEASDIHLETEEKTVKARFRVDGVLHDVAVIAKENWGYLVSRIKLNAGLKINIQDKPQDGNFTLNVQGSPIDFRVSTLPTNYGESVVIRILFYDKIRKMSLDNLGVDDYNRAILLKEIEKPNGLLAITGPTGAGKTTTLYAILHKLNIQENKIITVEDPIEYKLEGINQSEVREDKGYTFAKALRSIVRQDPDIILVGEIRDQETVEIVINAALTGHLVLSTIHANSAAGVIPRFMALGAKPYLLSPAINVVMAQRLIRRICNECKQEADLTEEIRQKIKQVLETLPEGRKNVLKMKDLSEAVFYKGKGCDKCAGLGYKGQIGIFEILSITDEIKELILSGEISEQRVRQKALGQGMATLEQDGILKAIAGITSLDEVFRVT